MSFRLEPLLFDNLDNSCDPDVKRSDTSAKPLVVGSNPAALLGVAQSGRASVQDTGFASVLRVSSCSRCAEVGYFSCKEGDAGSNPARLSLLSWWTSGLSHLRTSFALSSGTPFNPDAKCRLTSFKRTLVPWARAHNGGTRSRSRAPALADTPEFSGLGLGLMR